MHKNQKLLLIIAACFLTGAAVSTVSLRLTGGPNPAAGSGLSADPQKATGAPSGTNAHKLAAGEDYTRRLLLLMDTDKNGKVSKREFMAFMEKEFDRLDVNHDGELDVKELARIQVRPYVGK